MNVILLTITITPVNHPTTIITEQIVTIGTNTTKGITWIPSEQIKPQGNTILFMFQKQDTIISHDPENGDYEKGNPIAFFEYKDILFQPKFRALY